MTKDEIIYIAQVVGVVDFLYSNPNLQDAYEFLQRFAVRVEAFAASQKVNNENLLHETSAGSYQSLGHTG